MNRKTLSIIAGLSTLAAATYVIIPKSDNTYTKPHIGTEVLTYSDANKTIRGFDFTGDSTPEIAYFVTKDNQVEKIWYNASNTDAVNLIANTSAGDYEKMGSMHQSELYNLKLQNSLFPTGN